MVKVIHHFAFWSVTGMVLPDNYLIFTSHPSIDKVQNKSLSSQGQCIALLVFVSLRQTQKGKSF